MDNGRNIIISTKLFVRRLVAVTALCLLIIFAVYCGYLIFKSSHKTRNAGQPSGQAAIQRSWCVLKPGTSDNDIQQIINYSCAYVNCTIIEEGGDCFLPKDEINYASVVMNLYYQKEGGNSWNCNFNSFGNIVYDDPSFGSCTFPAGQQG